MVDYSKITLCPALEYKSYCQVGGRCDFCAMFRSKECKGCVANFKDKKLNIKAKFETKHALQHTPVSDKSNQ